MIPGTLARTAVAVTAGFLAMSAMPVAANAPAAEAAEKEQSMNAEATAHDFTFVGIAGDPLPLSQFEGRPVLVVNTASLCGFTPQYSGLQALYEEFQEDGFVVVGVPSNDFGGQEPGANEEIKDFCETNFNVRFPLTDKTVVKGENAHPFYKWAAGALGPDAAPKWNFHKYLVGPDGALVKAFPSSVEPTADAVKSAVRSLLK